MSEEEVLKVKDILSEQTEGEEDENGDDFISLPLVKPEEISGRGKGYGGGNDGDREVVIGSADDDKGGCDNNVGLGLGNDCPTVVEDGKNDEEVGIPKAKGN
jgi:hypothetical protein